MLIALSLSGTYRRVSREDFWTLFKISALGFFVFQFFFTEGIDRTTSGNVAFILCLMPISVLILNKFYGLEEITRPVVIGIICSISGVTCIVLGSGNNVSLASNHFLGTLFILFSQAGYAYYTVFSKGLLERYSALQVTTYLVITTTCLLFLVSLPSIIKVDWASLPPVVWGSIFFSGVFSMTLGNFLWIWGVGIIGTSRVAIFNNISPVSAIITAYFLLGETFGIQQALGAVLIFAGVFITRNKDRFLGKKE